MLLLTLIVLWGVNPVISAQAQANDESIEIELNNMDLSQPYSESNTYIDENGNEYTTTLSFIPSKTRSSNPASVGTWTSKYDGFGMNMSYKFDVSKSGTQWKISNARSHTYSGIFLKFTSPKLYISRAVSTNSFPAEVNAEVTVDYLDNQWVHLYTNTWIMYTTIDSGGTMTVYNN